ncbi:hypothetical protein KSF_009690 [Reticulibacter mediterranei]|uniref:Pentapeptide repeat-containing protein n=1 Tax=Reticulibacter mediterranei TaxID=2778369 RepID=A0A8J3IJV5_9CHLR|nr:pentapeptide repeat-containing protein [Reticulibacter mediterranei]GHO90921.1 hypothetical protein KSF_009690 [Reticulibacter mediterranei]
MAQASDEQSPATIRPDEREQGTAFFKPQQQQGKQREKSDWIGLRGKTLWDWVSVLLLPLMIAAGSIWFSNQQSETSAHIALDQQQEATLKGYMDDIKELVLEKHLQTSQTGSQERTIARTLTLSALQQLDGDRKGRLIQYISNLGLLQKEHPIIGLSGADLSRANLSSFMLSRSLVYDVVRMSLRDANLSGADLTEADLMGADLQGAQLRGTDLRAANLTATNLEAVDLTDANVRPEQLSKVYSLKDTILPSGHVFPDRIWATIPGRDERCAVLNSEGQCYDLKLNQTNPAP